MGIPTANLGGNASFPICQACDAHVSKAVINGQKPRCPKLDLFLTLPLVGRRAAGEVSRAPGEIFPLTGTWFRVGTIVKPLALRASAPYEGDRLAVRGVVTGAGFMGSFSGPDWAATNSARLGPTGPGIFSPKLTFGRNRRAYQGWDFCTGWSVFPGQWIWRILAAQIPRTRFR